jgi:hypothetical protein
MCMALNAPGWCMCACIHSPGCISGDGAAAAHAAAMASGERSTCEPSQVSKKLPGMTHLETGIWMEWFASHLQRRVVGRRVDQLRQRDAGVASGTCGAVQVNRRTHVPSGKGLNCSISLSTNPVLISSVPIQTVR